MGDEYNRTGMYAKERKARPLEAYAIFQHQTLRDLRKLDEALSNALVVTLLQAEDAGFSLQQRISDKKAEIEQRLDSRAGALANERRQYAAAEREKDRWSSPSCPEGWLCHKSPTGVCEYEAEVYGDDCCDFCGDPGERK